MKKKKRIFHVISNTHWDREWRFPFQKNRQMLVEMIDRLLEILQKEPEYRAFHLDSQAIVLEDYLAIRPDKKELIKKFVREKRLLIGPWFILPDEFQVGGESLIRNLLLGHKICAEFGHIMKVGYSPFSWGQISQLPQIYTGFGIDVVMFYRGVNSLDSPKAEFIWEGADGTRVLTSRFSTMPRYNFYFYIYRPVIHNEQFSDIEYKWSRGGAPFHFSDAELKDEDYSIIDPVVEYYTENLKPSIEKIIADQADDFTTSHIFWAEGHDSSGPHIKTVQIIRDANQILAEDEVVHSTLEDYANALKNNVNESELSLVKGEQRSAQFDNRSGNLYGYTTSARMYVKQENFTTEKWLQFYAEPFNAIAHLLGLNINDRYLDIAWHLLLQNSAHDSIGGCSLDEIHVDMMNRYKQSQEISRGVFSRACKHLAKQIDLTKYPPDSIHLIAVNPNTFSRNEVVEAFIDVPANMDLQEIEIRERGGKTVPVQIVEKVDSQPVVEQMIDRPMFFQMKRYRCFLQADEIPAMGYKSFHFQPTKKVTHKIKQIGRVENGLHVLENEFLKITVNKNGSLNVLDKVQKKEYRDIGYFYDEGEAGHAWMHEPVEPFLNTLDEAPKIEFELNGPLVAVCRISYQFLIPKNLADRKQNVSNTVMPIELKMTLKKNARRVEFDIRLDNPAEDHRLRMMFPTGIAAKYSYGEGQFDVVKRSTDRPDTGDWVEQPMYDFPMHHFVDVTDDQQGAAVLVDGLKEYEVSDDERTTLAITLFRAFKYVIQPSSKQDYAHQKGSQCLGKHAYRLAFYPHAGNWEQGNVYSEALRFNKAVRLFQIGRTAGHLPEDVSLLRVEPDNLIFSCLKQPQANKARSFILRLYNPTEGDIDGKVRSFFNVNAVRQVTLEENFVQDVPLKNQTSFQFQVKTKKIITFLIEFENHSFER